MSDTWSLITGYTVPDYSDTVEFEVDGASKKLAKVTGQTLVAGEENSQYIKFVMPRYWDGIDISEKTITIAYQLGEQYFGTSAAVGAERTDNKVRFGWIVPEEACAETGTLMFVIVITDTNYVLKSQITELSVAESLDPEGEIPEPSQERWYIEFQERVEAVLSDAEDAVTIARQSADAAEDSADNAAEIKEQVDNTKSQLDEALLELLAKIEQIAVNKNDITTLTGRLDQMVGDYDASTETELMDARVGHNGITYGSVGAAIRGQFNELRLYVDESGYICQTGT